MEHADEADRPDAPCAGFALHEASLSPVVRFMVDKDVVGCGWLDLDHVRLVPVDKQKTTCDVEVVVDVAHLRARPEATENAPFRILALDIEVMALDVNVFPTADKCPVIQMSAHARAFGQPEKDRKIVFCLQETDDLEADDVEIVSMPNEAALLHAIYAFVRDYDPEILTGYNSNKQENKTTSHNTQHTTQSLDPFR